MSMQTRARCPRIPFWRASETPAEARQLARPATQTSTSACSLTTLLSGRCFTKRQSAWPMPTSPPRSLRQSAWAGWWPYANPTDGCVRWSLAISSGGWSCAPWRSSLARPSNRHAFQYGLGTRAGTEALSKVLRVATELDPRATVLSVDAVGAYDHLPPGHARGPTLPA